MTLLKWEDLKAAISEANLEDRLVITPILDPDTQIGPASIDLRLSTQFIETKRRAEAVHDPFSQEDRTPGDREPIDPAHPMEKLKETVEPWEEEIVVPLGDRLALHPGQFILGATLEFIGMPTDMGGQVLGRSSWGRIGLIVATAVVVQPGFRGCLTLELVNMGALPMFLYPGLRIAQLQVWKTNGRTDHEYGGGRSKYQVPLGPQSTRLGWEKSERAHIFRMGDIAKGSAENVPAESGSVESGPPEPSQGSP